MSHYLVEISSSNEETPCTALPSGQPGLGLDENGITWQNESAPICIDVLQNELHITRQPSFSGQIVVARNGRERQLLPKHPIQLFAEDEIRLNDKSYRIQNIIKNSSTRFERAFESLRTASRALMMSTAAALVLTACNPAQTVAPQITGDVARVVPEESENAPAEALPNLIDINAHPGDEYQQPPNPETVDVNAHPGESNCPSKANPEAVKVNAHPGGAHHADRVDVNAHPGGAHHHAAEEEAVPLPPPPPTIPERPMGEPPVRPEDLPQPEADSKPLPPPPTLNERPMGKPAHPQKQPTPEANSAPSDNAN